MSVDVRVRNVTNYYYYPNLVKKNVYKITKTINPNDKLLKSVFILKTPYNLSFYI